MQACDTARVEGVEISLVSAYHREELWVMENEPTVLIELSEAGKKFYKSKKT